MLSFTLVEVNTDPDSERQPLDMYPAKYAHPQHALQSDLLALQYFFGGEGSAFSDLIRTLIIPNFWIRIRSILPHLCNLKWPECKRVGFP
jgi:hypothetical protein